MTPVVQALLGAYLAVSPITIYAVLVTLYVLAELSPWADNVASSQFLLVGVTVFAALMVYVFSIQTRQLFLYSMKASFDGLAALITACLSEVLPF